MFTRFTTIVNSLKNIGKNYSNQELIRKILRCLPRSWTPKVTAIEEAKDLSTLPLEQLIGSLMTHYIALITSQFKKFLKSQKGKKTFKKKFSKNEESSKKEESTCYECKKQGHLKNECPNLKKKEQLKKSKEQSKKKKSFVATWDDSDSLSSKEESDEEVVNLALMSMDEEEEDEVNFSFDEFQDAYENLFHEYKNVCIKNKSLKKDVCSKFKEIETLKSENIKYINEIESLKIENSYYRNEIEVLNVSSKFSNDSKEENENLKIEIDALKKTFSMFSSSNAKLDNLLGLQRYVLDKAGLGYEELINVKHFNNFFVKKIEPKIICIYCGRIGHISTSCYLKNNLGLVKTRKIWVPK
ncbi:zf-CCHC domain-containing protein/UBN2 domain-containing protein [Cephalotus follicularis]|uniref:Zf-CCHC domain-containing protein/UBN2 domain-containing protein n=1 Tax=Cephalotus follicularis TaxID=3775 RepID=A0A1Q3ANM9_CEPFO|nr:zf-CCHC domain-containing protein/UBN2 domain-containing protein [Cephalotus follicularis]